MTTSGVCASAVLLGGTFKGLTALGLMSGRALVSFSVGQVISPSIASFLAERTGSLQSASRLAAAALLIAAVLAAWLSGQRRRL